MLPNWLKRIVETLVEPIRTRANNNDLDSLLGVPDAATKSIYGDLGDFMAQTNLKSLLAEFGSGWDTANKDLYTLLITDLLSNGTHGLAALKVLIDAVEAKLDDGTTGLAALKALIDAVEAKLDDGTTGLAALKVLIDAVEAKLDDGTTGLAALKALIDAVEAKLDDGTTGLAALKTLIEAVEGKLDTIEGALGIFYERDAVAVNITAVSGSETNVFNLSEATTRYIVRHLRLKFADPSTDTVTVRLYELINAVSTVVDTFIVDNTNFGTYFSLMDMFGVPHLAGDNLKVTVQVSGGAGVAVTGQYSFGRTYQAP
jgi:hypothetical protein